MAVFKIKRRTLGSDLKADDFVRKLSDPDAALYRGVAITLSRLLTNTEAIEFTPQELAIQEIQSFDTAWQERNERDPNQLFCWYMYELDGSLNDLWYAAYVDANKPLLPPEQLGSQFLSEEQKEALKDPENPTQKPVTKKP